MAGALLHPQQADVWHTVGPHQQSEKGRCVGRGKQLIFFNTYGIHSVLESFFYSRDLGNRNGHDLQAVSTSYWQRFPEFQFQELF